MQWTTVLVLTVALASGTFAGVWGWTHRPPPGTPRRGEPRLTPQDLEDLEASYQEKLREEPPDQPLPPTHERH